MNQHETHEESKALNWLKKIFWSPWTATAIAILAGALISWHFYSAAQAERQLVYSTNPIRTHVVTAGRTTGLQISFNGESLSSANVTSVEIAIWNKGKASIREENILGDGNVTIVSDPPSRILEASVMKCPQPVTQFRVGNSSESLSAGEVPISWSILEQNDGADVQLIYIGSDDVKFSVTGQIEGMHHHNPIAVTAGAKIATPEEQINQQQSTHTSLVYR